MRVLFGDLIPGETPIDDVSGLKIKGIKTRKELNEAEAMNIAKVLVDYFGGRPRKIVPAFDLNWSRGIHGEMFGDVWDWAGRFRTHDMNIGVVFSQIQEHLFNLFCTFRNFIALRIAVSPGILRVRGITVPPRDPPRKALMRGTPGFPGVFGDRP